MEGTAADTDPTLAAGEEAGLLAGAVPGVAVSGSMDEGEIEGPGLAAALPGNTVPEETQVEGTGVVAALPGSTAARTATPMAPARARPTRRGLRSGDGGWLAVKASSTTGGGGVTDERVTQSGLSKGDRTRVIGQGEWARGRWDGARGDCTCPVVFMGFLPLFYYWLAFY